MISETVNARQSDDVSDNTGDEEDPLFDYQSKSTAESNWDDDYDDDWFYENEKEDNR